MTNKTIIVIISLIVLVLVIFGAWRFLFSSEALAPVSEESDTQENVSAAEETAPGQFMQQAPEADPLENENVEEEADVESEVTISMTDTGFVPDTITVPMGTKVTFVNNGQALHWPASDNHPTHDILPEFDSKRGLSTGESYSYTFEEAGSWGFHDHLNAQFRGTVVVE